MDALDKKIAKHVVLWLVVFFVLTGLYRLIFSVGPDGDLYQVVLLNNDQAFYGKLHKVHSDYPYLTDVYYLQPQKAQVDEFGNQIGGDKFTVVKRGSEIHSPVDRMYFAKKSVVYWENVGAGSLVEQGIIADKDVRKQQEEQAVENN